MRFNKVWLNWMQCCEIPKPCSTGSPPYSSLGTCSMSKWPKVSLNEVCKMYQPQTIGGRDLLNGGRYPVYGANGQIGFYGRFNHADAEVTVTCRGATCGTVNVIPGPSWITGNAMVVKPLDERITKGYLARVLSATDFSSVITGAAQPQITRKPLERVVIPLPPIEEQRRIAAVLDKADEVRDKRRAALDTLDTLTKSIFIEMFIRRVSERNGWRSTPLGGHLQFLTSGSRGWARYYEDEGSAFLRIQNVLSDEIDLSDVAHVAAPNNAEATRTRIKSGDVLMSITADLGRTCVVPPEVEGGFINQHLCLMRTETLVPRYLSAFLASSDAMRQIQKRNKQAVKAGLNFDDVRSLEIPLPPRQLQEEFANRAAAVDKNRIKDRRALVEMDELFASLQRRAFQGEP